MSIRATLQELARQVRRDTLQILDAAEPEWLMYSPPGTSNHLLWHAGHALWLQDVLCVKVLTGREELSASWAEKFGMNCRPVSQTVEWPGRDEVRELLERQLVRLMELLDDTPDEQLARAPIPGPNSATASGRIIHGLHDEAKHSGEMYLLLKMCRSAKITS